MIIIDKEQQNEHIGELFQDNRGVKPTIYKNIRELVLKKSEVKLAVVKINRNKVIGPDMFVIKMISSLDDLLIDYEIVNEISQQNSFYSDAKEAMCK